MLASSGPDAPTVPASEPPVADPPVEPATAAPRAADRIISLLEVLACSGVTQLVLGQLLIAAGVFPITAGGQLSLPFVVAVTLGDTAAIVALVVFFLASVLVGRSPKFEGMRANRKKWMTVTILLAAVVVAIGGFLKVHYAQKGLPTETQKPAAVSTE